MLYPLSLEKKLSRPPLRSILKLCDSLLEIIPDFPCLDERQELHNSLLLPPHGIYLILLKVTILAGAVPIRKDLDSQFVSSVV